MPRKKKLTKPIQEMTTEELAQKVFHPKVLAQAKKELRALDSKPPHLSS